MPDETDIPARPDVAPREDFRATSDRMLQFLDDLRSVEGEKRKHPIGSPEFVTHAQRAEELSRLIFRWSQMQEAMAEDAAARDLPADTIAEVPSRPIHGLLADWREAELRLVAAAPGSPEAEEAANRIESLRAEYHELMRRQRGDEVAGERGAGG